MASYEAQPNQPDPGRIGLATQPDVSMVFILGSKAICSEPLMHALSPWEGPVESGFNFIYSPLGVL